MSLTTDVTATFPAHDPAGWRQLPRSFTPLDPARVSALMAKEWERFAKVTPGSADHAARSVKTLPLGVTSSFQYWDPYPMAVKSARLARLQQRQTELTKASNERFLGREIPVRVEAHGPNEAGWWLAHSGEWKTIHLKAGPGRDLPFGELVRARVTLASPHFLGAELV